MGLFSGRSDAPDARPRELVLTGEPLVAHGGEVLAVDLTVRFTPKPRPTDTDIPEPLWQPSWVADDERAISAVVVTTLRLLGDQRSSDDLLTERAIVVAAVDAALAVAPVAPLFEARTLRVELAPNVPVHRRQQEFRVVG